MTLICLPALQQMDAINCGHGTVLGLSPCLSVAFPLRDAVSLLGFMEKDVEHN